MRSATLPRSSVISATSPQPVTTSVSSFCPSAPWCSKLPGVKVLSRLGFLGETLKKLPVADQPRRQPKTATTTTPIPARPSIPSPRSTRRRIQLSVFGTDTTDEDGKYDFLTYRPGILRRGHTRTSLPLHRLARVANGGPTFPDLGDAVLLQGNSHQRFPDLLQLDVTEAKLYGFGGYVNGTIVLHPDTDDMESWIGDAGTGTSAGDAPGWGYDAAAVGYPAEGTRLTHWISAP
ncbi:hypothetical protein THAOC_06436 [Thalassiosira oceanica]|uniref:Uncharacterized protein n=1 Tax=Thalassiosira oceanica TaxID=159749 RepID=K0TLR3_THAOC|nr:hypothetical protein THAOC_06436 [Thalassiosira oceanica]|eukprot:EJK72072.1 hypothetical protein THAOC_06436 [Thalassiosira oceanica]